MCLNTSAVISKTNFEQRGVTSRLSIIWARKLPRYLGHRYTQYEKMNGMKNSYSFIKVICNAEELHFVHHSSDIAHFHKFSVYVVHSDLVSQSPQGPYLNMSVLYGP